MTKARLEETNGKTGVYKMHAMVTAYDILAR